MYNIQIIQYVMVLYNVTEINYMDVMKINKQLQTLKRYKTLHLVKG